MFLYTDKDLPNICINVNLRDASIEKTLTEIFKGLHYSYKVVESNILVRKQEQNASGDSITFNSQVRIAGKVTDKLGVALAGSTVRIEGTSQGVISDSEGRFEIIVLRKILSLYFLS